MAGLVTVTGNAWDHSQTVIPAAQSPELWFVPGGPGASGGLLADKPVQATLTAATGAFTVKLVSDGPNVWYRPRMRWLEPGGTPGFHGFTDWPFRVYPDVGGDIAALIDLWLGNDLVYVSDDVVNTAQRAGLQLDATTGNLYQRKVTF